MEVVKGTTGGAKGDVALRSVLQYGAQTSTDFRQSVDENTVPELKTTGRNNIKQRRTK